jgi:hypothetical protein
LKCEALGRRLQEHRPAAIAASAFRGPSGFAVK